ncbi:IclR family transcriptional regulator [Glutamicibacter ardleyensis]|uniref:IclR family transcriptional regulator n=1 Tax=Glutamicibacter ardleyensis TaxID=225894 RepID=UPI003FB91E09
MQNLTDLRAATVLISLGYDVDHSCFWDLSFSWGCEVAQPTLIGSVQKALRLLEAVAASGTAISAKKLARITEFPLPTTYHLLRTLEFEGYLCKIDGGYALGASSLTVQNDPIHELVPRVRPVLRSLSDELGVATYLTTYQDDEIHLLAMVEGREGRSVDLWVGVHESGHATAFGKAILANLSDELRDDYINRHDLHDLTPNTITSRGGLERNLSVGSKIWSDKEEYLLGISCHAAPIQNNGMVGAIAVSLPSQRKLLESEEASLKRAARRLGLAMGPSLISI